MSIGRGGDGGGGPVVTAEGVQLDHHPDPQKSRGQYLPLLELSVAEDPEDDRNLHYLGREYLYYGRWDDCIATLQRHLTMPTATWADERAASMRYIAKAHAKKGKRDEARDWYLRAAAEAPHLREPWVDLAMLLYEDQEWDGVLYATACALKISIKSYTRVGFFSCGACNTETDGLSPFAMTAFQMRAYIMAYP